MQLKRVIRLLAAVSISVLQVGPVSAAATKPRVLIIAVDAISYDLVVKLTDPSLGEKAIFQNLKGPTAIINAFPTNSYVAWSGLLEPLGIKKANGYEAEYFDNERREVHGAIRLGEPRAPWKDFFDARLKGVIRGAIAYGWPKKFSRLELKDGLEAFLASEKQVFSMYIVSTDGIGHIFGPDGLADFLKDMDKQLIALRENHPDKPFHTFIFSDHGMPGGEPLKNTWSQLKDAVKKAGFNLSDRLEDESDVVFIPFGLLTSFVVYTQSGKEKEVAETAASVPGVDLCVITDHEGWKVISSRGSALIRRQTRQGKTFWAYLPVTGDPLNYAPIVKKLRHRAGAGRENWFPDQWWFQAGKNAFYPDALYRLAHSFDLVLNPASMVCSISPGYMFGALKTEYIAIPTIGRLRWTHGALHRDASLGFLMTDIPGWNAPDKVRFNQALAPLAELIKSLPASRRQMADRPFSAPEAVEPNR